MPPSDPAAVCLCGSPHVDWTANGKLMCAMCAANFVAASGSFVTPAAVPPPEWAVEKADEWLRRSDEDPLLTLASLLASVREGALREAAVEGATAATEGRSVSIAIHALIHTPPSGGGA